MIKNSEDYKGIYSEMVEILGEDIVRLIYQNYKGQQVTFPMKLYSNEYVERYIDKNINSKTIREMCRELGYTEGWIKHLINKNKIRAK